MKSHKYKTCVQCTQLTLVPGYRSRANALHSLLCLLSFCTFALLCWIYFPAIRDSVSWYAAVLMFAPLLWQIKNSDVMLGQNRWRNANCNAEPFQALLCMLPLSCHWFVWTRSAAICTRHMDFYLKREKRHTIWSLQVRTHPCTFP